MSNNHNPEIKNTQNSDVLLPDSKLEQEIKQRLAPLMPTSLELIDESYKHIGHKGVQERGGRHYNLIITSAEFNNLKLIQRHQRIYQLLDDLLKQKIHALKITAQSTNC